MTPRIATSGALTIDVNAGAADAAERGVGEGATSDVGWRELAVARGASPRRRLRSLGIEKTDRRPWPWRLRALRRPSTRSQLASPIRVQGHALLFASGWGGRVRNSAASLLSLTQLIGEISLCPPASPAERPHAR
jgi:hypothetical protein